MSFKLSKDEQGGNQVVGKYTCLGDSCFHAERFNGEHQRWLQLVRTDGGGGHESQYYSDAFARALTKNELQILCEFTDHNVNWEHIPDIQTAKIFALFYAQLSAKKFTKRNRGGSPVAVRMPHELLNQNTPLCSASPAVSKPARAHVYQSAYSCYSTFMI